MTCDDLLRYLSAYIDNELDETLSQAAQEHLSTCHNCQVVLNTTQQVVLLGRGQQQRFIPRERRERLFTQLQATFLQHTGPAETKSTEE